MSRTVAAHVHLSRAARGRARGSHVRQIIAASHFSFHSGRYHARLLRGGKSQARQHSPNCRVHRCSCAPQKGCLKAQQR